MTDDRQRYQHNLRCRACAHRFHVVRLTEDPNKVRPACPKCGGKTKQSFHADVGFDPAEGKAPGLVGSIPTRAFDTTMEMTMADYGMTDIKDHARPGENTVPALPVHLQQAANDFWKGPQKQQKMKVDMSPIYGSRAARHPNAGPGRPSDTSLIEPILKAKPTGSSAVPNHTVVADSLVNGKHVLQ